jgi:putative protease
MSFVSPASPRPELLAPAGDWEAMRAAVANGADAVYFGLSNFNARHRATNFTLEELPQVMGYLHGHNVRGYVTFNTLVFSDELPEAVRFITAVAQAGADAVIVQDLGLARLIRRLAPTLPVHGSTQMTLTEPRGIEFVRELGVQRVILARELSAADIARITTATAVPVEIFIHGALCVSYSGQCLTSEAIGGRSANRGQCAQACRLPYDLVVDGRVKDLGDKAYLLSPQDLAAHDIVADLAKLGVCSLKIEGRLKSAHYVAATTQTYRAAIDATGRDQPFTISDNQRKELAQSFSRGFTHGFLDGVDHQELVHARFPKSRGIRAAKVLRVTGEGVIVEALVELKPGDGVVFDEGHPEQDEQGGRVIAVNRSRHSAGSQVTRLNGSHVGLVFHKGDVNLSAISPGAIVWKTDDPAVRRKLEQTYRRDVVARRIPMQVTIEATEGGPLTIHARAADTQATATWPGPLQRALKFPVTPELLREQLARLGDTPFELTDVQIPGDLPPVMVPKSVLNDLRRRLVQDLLTKRSSAHPVSDPHALENTRAAVPSSIHDPPSSPILYALARTLEQLEAITNWTGPVPLGMAYAEFEDVKRYKDAVSRAQAAGVPIALATTRIIKPGEEGLLRHIADCQPDSILIRNLAALSFFKQHSPALPLVADYALNVANELTASILAEQRVVRMVPSYDLSWKQLAALLERFPPTAFEAVIHQHMPMFHMEHCVFCHTLSTGHDHRDCGRPCDHHRVDLRDRVGADNPLIADVGCRNTVYNGLAQSAAEFVPQMKALGLRHFRVELLREDAGAARQLLDRYAALLSGQSNAKTAWRQLKVLNQLGVTRGTLNDD